jgi:hypothetical protein
MRHLAAELNTARVLLDAVRVLVNIEATRFRLLVEGHPEAESWAPECVAMTEALLGEITLSVARARTVVARVRSLDMLPTPSPLGAADRAIDLLEAGQAELRVAIRSVQAAHLNLQHMSCKVFDALMARLCVI